MISIFMGWFRLKLMMIRWKSMGLQTDLTVIWKSQKAASPNQKLDLFSKRERSKRARKITKLRNR